MQRAGKENCGSGQTTHTVDAFKISAEIFLCSILNTAKPKHHLKSNAWCSGAPYVACMNSISYDQSSFASQTSNSILPDSIHSLFTSKHSHIHQPGKIIYYRRILGKSASARVKTALVNSIQQKERLFILTLRIFWIPSSEMKKTGSKGSYCLILKQSYRPFFVLPGFQSQMNSGWCSFTGHV